MQFFWGSLDQKGEEQLQKIGSEGTQNSKFSATKVPNILKNSLVSRKNGNFFGVLGENLAKSRSILWFYTNLDVKNIVFSILKKFRKISDFFGNFEEFFEKNSRAQNSKFSKIVQIFDYIYILYAFLHLLPFLKLLSWTSFQSSHDLYSNNIYESALLEITYNKF